MITMLFEFSPTQRLILYNQFVIMAEQSRLQNDESCADYYDLLADIISNGYTHDYDEFDRLICDEMNTDECKLVWDILSVYEKLQLSAKKTEIEELIESSKFRGFDGNYESELMKYCDFIINKMNRFKYLDLDNADLNSHSKMSEYYKLMINRCSQFKDDDFLTEEQIRSVLNINDYSY